MTFISKKKKKKNYDPSYTLTNPDFKETVSNYTITSITWSVI